MERSVVARLNLLLEPLVTSMVSSFARENTWMRGVHRGRHQGPRLR